MGMVMVIDVVRKSLSSLTYPHKYETPYTVKNKGQLTYCQCSGLLDHLSAPD
jgi:hypothetical protein